MSSSRATKVRGRTGIPWDLVPVALLAGCLLIVLGQRAMAGLARVAAEVRWLVPAALALAAGFVLGVAALWVWTRQRAGVAAERQRRAWLGQLCTLDGLRALTPTAFELAVAELLRELGYPHVEHTGGSGDLCADLTCVSASGQRVVVQCKRYGAKRLVGSPEMQQFLGMMAIHHRAERGIYITTSGYTRHALALASRHADALQVIDGERLVRLMCGMR